MAARKQTFLDAVWTERFKESYASLPLAKQRQCDDAALSLIKRESSPGLRIKPINPDKYYSEARLNSGDRVIFRVEEGAISFIDVVTHDEIARYGKRPKQSG